MNPSSARRGRGPLPAAVAQDGPAATRGAAEAVEVRFTGEVAAGKEFRHEIGHGLVFGLAPLVGDAGGGWVIDIVPSAQPGDEPVEFSEVVTPPYHFYNDRYLASAYGYSVKEAVAMTPRHFNFVMSTADDRIAEDVVNSALYPSAASDQEKDRIARESAGLHLGHGEFRILKSHVTIAKGPYPDTIDWLKFEVSVSFSPGLTLQSVLAPKPAAH
ncbi:MAG: hypothetical protein ABSE45_07225 [Candidatus Acidiferrales bacterium]